ncbi:MAG: amidophosphoribosyltransferase [Thermoguttaceae bacterium]|nr:amidophosphoribosyltransferase [Thermoguttaceae bacterium]
MSDLHEECGIVAIYHFVKDETSPLCPTQGQDAATRLLPRMLLDLQNRGQLSAGVTTYNANRGQLLKTYKDVGVVSEVFRMSHRDKYEKIMLDLSGRAAIGHVRYSSVGEGDYRCIHPFERRHFKRNKYFSFAFNGQLANCDALRESILKAKPDVHFSLDGDTEIFEYRLCAALKDDERDLCKVCQTATKDFDGAYTVAFINAYGEMFLCRDPRGMKPLCYACDGSLFAAASESVALFNLGFRQDQIVDLEPGKILIVNEKGFEIKEFAPSPRTAHCFFEWVYFANAASVIDGKSVYIARKHLGEELAKLETQDLDDDCIVVPVPDTAKAAADGLAYALGIPCLEGLMRNRYTGRTFIEQGVTRWRKAESKYTPLPEVLEGKRVFLVEDSIVRSTTMRVLVDRIRNVGRAKEIHVRVACPPVVAPCFYGIYMSTYPELFATKFIEKYYGFTQDVFLATKWRLTEELQKEMAADIGCDSLRYLPVNLTSKAIGLPALHLCQACVSHEYPTEWGSRLSECARKEYLACGQKATYEQDHVRE